MKDTDKRISLRIDPEVYDRIAREAKARGMQIATYTRALVFKALAEADTAEPV